MGFYTDLIGFYGVYWWFICIQWDFMGFKYQKMSDKSGVHGFNMITMWLWPTMIIVCCWNSIIHRIVWVELTISVPKIIQWGLTLKNWESMWLPYHPNEYPNGFRHTMAMAMPLDHSTEHHWTEDPLVEKNAARSQIRTSLFHWFYSGSPPRAASLVSDPWKLKSEGIT
jgi:hypothetical protein